MKKILILLFSLFSLIGFSQTTIPYAGFLGEISNVTTIGGGIYEITSTLNDQSGRFNGNIINDSTFVVWQNCNRYVVSSTVQLFPSEVVIRVEDVDSAGAPSTGFISVIQESDNLSVGFFISGILDSRNQCALSYYAERFDQGLSTEISDGGVFYQAIAFGNTYELPEDTLKKYPRLVFYSSGGNLVLPNLDISEQSEYLGTQIDLFLVSESGGQFIVSSQDSFSIRVRNCSAPNSLKSGNDTLSFSQPSLFTYNLIRLDDYQRFCDDYSFVFNGDVIEAGDSVTIEQTQNFRYNVSNASTTGHVLATGAGITITQNSGAGEVVVAIPQDVELLSLSLFMPSSVTDGGAYHIVLDYTGERAYNTAKANIKMPMVRTGLDGFASASRGNPVNISENGGNSANTVTYGVSALGGGDGSDLGITLINFSLGINQFCTLDFHNID